MSKAKRKIITSKKRAPQNAAPAVNPDQPIIDACLQWAAIYSARETAFKIDPCGNSTTAERLTDEWDTGPLLKMASGKAETLMGIGAKARLLKFIAEQGTGTEEFNETGAVKFAASVGSDIADLIRGLPNAFVSTADATLLDLGRQLDHAWANQRSLESASAKKFEVAFNEASAIVRMIEKAPARTLAGLTIKARAVEWCQGDEPLDFAEGKTTDIRLAQSIVTDLLALRTLGVQS